MFINFWYPAGRSTDITGTHRDGPRAMPAR